LIDKIIEEVFAVLAALGQEMPWADADSYRSVFYEQLLPPTREHFSSMLQDIQRGRKTEIDAINGAVCLLGQKLKIQTPVNQIITAMLKAKELIAKG